MGHKLKWGFLVVFVLVFWVIAQTPAKASPLACETTRIFGNRQIDTAVEVSKAGWEHSETVLIANATSFPDALVASPLSHKLDAPILLTTVKGVDEKVMEEIKRLGANHAILLGGEAVLGKQVVEDVLGAGLTWDRIYGYDRFETAAKVAERVGSTGDVILVNGEQFPDALSISPYAGITETPILLTKSKAMPDITGITLQKLLAPAIAGEGAVRTLVVGGEAVVPGDTLAGVPGIKRIAGDTRYDTAAKVYFFAKNYYDSDKAYLVSGENFPDALVAGALAARYRAGIFMSKAKSLPAITYSVLSSAVETSPNVALVGGTAALGPDVEGVVKGEIQPDYLLAGMTIAVDPGHGGRDTGAIGATGTYEKNNTLPIGLALADLLRSAGANVVMTRTTDVTPSGSYSYDNVVTDLDARVKIANNAKADLFISIHNDSFNSPTAYGTATYYSPDNPAGGEKSKALAQVVQNEVVKTIGLYNRGLKTAGYYVLKNTTMPAVLVEVGFISYPAEEKLLASPEFRKKAAEGIFRGILVYKGY